METFVGNAEAKVKSTNSPAFPQLALNANEQKGQLSIEERLDLAAHPHDDNSVSHCLSVALEALYIRGIQRPIEGLAQLGGNKSLAGLHRFLPHIEGEAETATTTEKIFAGIGDVLGETIPIAMAALIARRIAPHVVAEEAAAGKVVGQKLEAFAQRLNRGAALKKGIPPEIDILLNPGGQNHSRVAGALGAVAKGLQAPLTPRGGWLRFATHEAPMTGFIAESLFQPAPDDQNIALWRMGAGAKGAALATLQFGATTGLMRFVPSVSSMRILPGGAFQKVAEKSSAVSGGSVGFVYGAVSAQADSLYNKHEFASVKDTLTSAGSRAIVGTTLGLGYDYRYSVANIKYKFPELDFMTKP